MRVVNIVTQMEAAGAQRIAWNLTDGLPHHGHDTMLIFLYTKRDVYGSHDRVLSLFPAPPRSCWDYCCIFWRLCRFLASHRPDAVITHTHYSNVLGQFMAWFLRIPVRIAVQHNVLQSYPRAARFVDYLMGSMFFYHQNVVVSRAVEKSAGSYPRSYRKRIAVIRNGVKPLPEVLSEAQSYFPPDLPIIISVGRFARQKNHEFLIDSMIHLPNTGLLLVGDGELRSELENKIHNLKLSKRIYLAGEVDHERVWALLKSANVFVFPSLYEATGLAMVEAMSAGVPVVASDIAATREVLSMADGTLAGILVKQGDPVSLAAAIRKILTNPVLATEMSKKGKIRAKDFNLQDMVSAYQKLLEKVAAQ